MNGRLEDVIGPLVNRNSKPNKLASIAETCWNSRMSQEQLTIASVTGVDVAFEIAGPGSRSYAFVIDWHIRFLLALAWFIIVSLIAINGALSLKIPANQMTFAFVILLPTLVLYFFYHPILEVATRGRTPGKRMAGVRIVTREGDVPTVGALLIRNLFRLVDTLPVFYIVGLISRHHHTTTCAHWRYGCGYIARLSITIAKQKSLQRFDQLPRLMRISIRILPISSTSCYAALGNAR